MYSAMSSLLWPLRAMNIATATASAPLMPSIWSWVGDVTRYDRRLTSAIFSPNHPAADTRIAAPLPQLLYGPIVGSFSHSKNIPPYPLFGYALPTTRMVSAVIWLRSPPCSRHCLIALATAIDIQESSVI